MCTAPFVEKCVHTSEQPRLGEGCHSHMGPTAYHWVLFTHVHSSPYWRKSVHTCTKLLFQEVGRFHMSTIPISEGGHACMLLTHYRRRLYRHVHCPPPTGVCSHMHTAPLNEGRHLHMCPPRLGKEGCSGMHRTTTSAREVVGACALPHVAQEVVQASAWPPVSM